MLSYEERMCIHEKEQSEIREIKNRVISKIRKPKTFREKIDHYILKIYAETGLYFFTPTEKYIYITIAALVFIFSVFNMIDFFSKLL